MASLLDIPEHLIETFADRPDQSHKGAPGLVRVSIGLYTDQADIDYLIAALKWISENRNTLRGEYQEDEMGNVSRVDGWEAQIESENPFEINI